MKENISGNALKELMKVVNHFFPNLVKELKDLEDPRKKEVKYSLSILVLTEIMNFLTHGEAQRRVEWQFNTEGAFNNLNKIVGGEKLKKMCDAEVFTDTFKQMKVKEFEDLRYKLVNRLIRNKTLDRFRIRGYLNVDIDASRFQRANYEVSPEWLHQTHDGKTTWYVGST